MGTSSMITKHFSHNELQCPSTKMVVMQSGFMRRVEELRVMYDRPMIINSACRSSWHNKIVRGHPNSLHIYDEPKHDGINGCCALDVSMKDNKDMGDFIALAWSLGFSVGAKKNMVHIDGRGWYVPYLRQTFFTYEN